MSAIQEHVSVRDLCTLKTGGAADFFMVGKRFDSIMQSIERAIAEKIPYRVIGEGSGLLISDSGFPGLLIQNKTNTVFFVHDTSQVIVDAGTPLRELIPKVLSHNYSGLEFLSNAYGTVGGAVYTNRSMFGCQMSDFVRAATLYIPGSHKPIQHVNRDWFEFRFQSSKLKDQAASIEPTRSQPTILTVTLQLSKMNQASCVQRMNYFHTLQKQEPHPQSPSLRVFDALITTITPPNQRTAKGVPLRPQFYIDKNQIKQSREADIQLFAPNPNYLINTRVGTSADARNLIRNIQKSIKAQYSFELEPLIEYVGFWNNPDEEGGTRPLFPEE